jgi:hypothetical protein
VVDRALEGVRGELHEQLRSNAYVRDEMPERMRCVWSAEIAICEPLPV